MHCSERSMPYHGSALPSLPCADPILLALSIVLCDFQIATATWTTMPLYPMCVTSLAASVTATSTSWEELAIVASMITLCSATAPAASSARATCVVQWLPSAIELTVCAQ